MKQQINLYLDRFHIKRVVLPAKTIYASLGLVLILLIATSVVLQFTAYNMHKVQIDLARQQQSLVTGNETLRVSTANRQVSDELQKAVAEANRNLLAKTRMLDWVKTSQSEQRIPFSALLEGLGRQHINGLWLSEVSIDQKGGAMRLQGNALEAKLVPIFLAALKQEQAFTGTEFKKIKIDKQDPDDSVMRFLLTTEQPELDEKPSANKRKTRT
jgi:hypothetical protein